MAMRRTSDYFCIFCMFVCNSVDLINILFVMYLQTCWYSVMYVLYVLYISYKKKSRMESRGLIFLAIKGYRYFLIVSRKILMGVTGIVRELNWECSILEIFLGFIWYIPYVFTVHISGRAHIRSLKSHRNIPL